MATKGDTRVRSTKKEGLGSTRAGGKKHRKTRFASKHVIDAPDAPIFPSTDYYGKKKKDGYSMKSTPSNVGANYSIAPFKRPGGGAAKPVNAYKLSADRMLLAFNKMLEEVREDLKKAGPIPVTEVNPRDVKMKGINVKLAMSGVTMSGFEEFIVKKVNVPTPDELKFGELWVSYELSVPHLHIAGRFETEGTHKKVDVKNTGEFQGNILFYSNAAKVTFMVDDDGALQVDTFQMKIKSLGVDINERNLQLGALGSAELKPLLDTQLHEYLKKYWKECATKVALKAKEKLNAVLRRIHKERQDAAIASKATNQAEDEARKIREVELRKCRERIARRPRRPADHPLSRDQSLLGWLYPPKHPMM